MSKGVIHKLWFSFFDRGEYKGGEPAYFDLNKIEWTTGVDEIGSTIFTTTNPHSEITWTKVKEEMDKL